MQGAVFREYCVRAKHISVRGIIVEGHRVASQKSKDYPYGTIEKQKPVFKELGLDLGQFYSGTLNISIAPFTFAMVTPEYTFRHVAWTDLHPPEDFSFSRCTVRFGGGEIEGYVYYPHPETKKRHFQNASILEILAAYIPGLKYGDQVEIELRADEVLVETGIK
jgi:hypothetical protein